MRYFVDFDRTLFDTDAFTAYLGGRETDGVLTFYPGELSQFLYPDAASFLRDKENAVTIITAGDVHIQEPKVKSALEGIPRIAVIYTNGKHKGDYLGPHTHLHEGALAVDDLPQELEQYAASCPPVVLYEMRRDGGAGVGKWPVIRSLAELP